MSVSFSRASIVVQLLVLTVADERQSVASIFVIQPSIWWTLSP